MYNFKDNSILSKRWQKTEDSNGSHGMAGNGGQVMATAYVFVFISSFIVIFYCWHGDADDIDSWEIGG